MEKENNINKYRTFFIVALIVAVVLLGTVLAIFSVENKKKITRENQEYLLDNTAQLSQSLDTTISDGYNNIKVLSELVSRSLDGPEFDISDIQSLIRNSVFDFMEFADKDGMDHNITGGVSDAQDRKYYLDAKAGNMGMELIYVSRATHETLLMFYAPIYFEDEFVGSLVGVYQAANKITNLLSTKYFGERAISYLATEEGRIIASNQGLDPRNELYVSNLVKDNPDAAEILNSALLSGETKTFSLKENATGGCIQKLPENGWFVIQIFPQKASQRMISESNKLSFYLVAFIVVMCIILLIALIKFYRSQQELLENARKQAESASEAKTDFLFSMSHDIRTPMNAILGYTDIAVRHQDDPERVADSLNKIKVSSGHLLNLINDILEMSRIESGKLELAKDPLDIRKILTGVIQMSQALAIPKSINFESDIENIDNPYVYADELHINEILINLISNAVKYTPEGGQVAFSVKEIGKTTDNKVSFRFVVKDTGIGMSEDFQKHLFETFTREQTSTVSKEEGSGLGLSIVKRIVDLSEGTIQVESKVGEGSLFTVEMAFDVMDAQAAEEYRLEKEQFNGFETIRDLENKKVLLVEDNEMNREIAIDILSETGLIIDTAEDGAIAVKTVAEKGADYYDFILMDIQMPVMNGYEATQKIREMPNGNAVPIIALSANAFKEDVDKSMEMGMNAHVAKPIDVRELFQVMHTLTR